ncbi:unnamed protein product [Rotaria sordida]|uniref:Uncharacterized protein n=1 Tax=Rotaria sordida TaxID=392033 RepID=A0A814S950_9BILA|nr:unnamed protein product [Rotaria sordida]
MSLNRVQQRTICFINVDGTTGRKYIKKLIVLVGKIKICKGGLGSSLKYLVEEKEQSEESSMYVLLNTTNYDYSQVKVKMDITVVHRQRLF